MYLSVLWSTVLSFPFLCRAATQNVTIDDTQTVGDPITGAHIVYRKPDNWACGCIPSCDCSTANPDKSIAYNHTWHEGSFWEKSDGNILVKLDVLFTGTSVYVYTILSSDWPAYDITFLMDGQTASHYNQSEAKDLAFVNGFISRYPMFSTSGLSSTQHNLTIAVGLHQKPDDLSMFMLDYVTYSFEPDTVTPTSSIPTPASSNLSASSSTTVPSNPALIASDTRSKTPVIVGSVIGVAVAVSIVLLIFVYYLRVKKRRHEQPTPTPFDTQEYQPSSNISVSVSGGLSEGVVVPDSKSRLQTRTSISRDTSGPSSTIGEQPVEGQSQATMLPMEAAMSLAAEVQRLRGEISRLSDRSEMQVDTLPPPYLEEECR